MSNERIDLTWLEGKTATREERIENICGDYDYVENLLSELKRCYEEIDRLRRATNVLDEYGIAAKLLGEVDPHSE